jgi:uncharacterized membrane protein
MNVMELDRAGAVETANPSPPVSVPRRIVTNIRGRVLAGLLAVLPFAITAWIVLWLFRTLQSYVISPVARWVVKAVGEGDDATLPLWFVEYAAPWIAIVAVIVILYFLGFFAQARVVRLLDAILLRAPIITPIHKSVRQVFDALGGSRELSRFRRVVLVEFPHPGMKTPGFVTASCRDEKTQKTILCVYVPTTPIPTTGYMLLIPEDEVTDLDWNLEETIQAVVSFGITAPKHVQYYGEPKAGSSKPDEAKHVESKVEKSKLPFSRDPTGSAGSPPPT